MTSKGTAPDPEGSGASSRPDDVVDLDALRAKRVEVGGGRRVRLGGRDWDLVAEVPFEFVEAWAARRRRRCVELLLADPAEADEFFGVRPSNDDFLAIIDLYGSSPGKSSAS